MKAEYFYAAPERLRSMDLQRLSQSHGAQSGVGLKKSLQQAFLVVLLIIENGAQVRSRKSKKVWRSPTGAVEKLRLRSFVIWD